MGLGAESAVALIRASHASYWGRSSSNRWIVAALFDGALAILLPLCFESLHHLGGKRPWLPFPDRARRGDDARRVLQTLHPHPRLVEGLSHRHRAVIRQQERVMTFSFEVRDDPVAQFRRSGHTEG